MMPFSSLILFKINVKKKDYRNTIRESNSLDPEQCQHFVGPITGFAQA